MKLLLKNTQTVRVIPDSAIGRSGQPWFIPDGGSNWRWQTAVAYRVGKLGKNVASRFMPRYIDAVTLLWVPSADDFAALDYMDGAVVCGKWLDVEGDIPAEELAPLTEFATIKTGDILAIPAGDDSESIEKNQHISLTFHNQEVLKFNIK